MAEQAKTKSPASRKGGPTAFDPKSPAIVQPYKRLVDEGFIERLTITFTPTGVEVVGVPDKRVAEVAGSGLTAGTAAPLGMILTAADKGNLIPKRSGDRKKKANAAAVAPLPEKTLTKRDFEGSDQELLARARAVANHCGGPTLVGRVRSSGSFGGRVTTTFQQWWERATPSQRASSLVIPSRKEEIGTAEIARFATMQCPFRDVASFVVPEAGPSTQGRPRSPDPPSEED